MLLENPEERLEERLARSGQNFSRFHAKRIERKWLRSAWRARRQGRPPPFTLLHPAEAPWPAGEKTSSQVADQVT